MIYLDNAATTPLADTALQTLIEVSRDTFGNPSSIHTFGRKAHQILRQARQTISQVMDVAPDTIYFTAGGSESNNLALKGYALAHQDKGKHIITTAIEHHSVLHTLEYLEERFGFEVTYLQPKNQVIQVQDIKEALRPDTILVTIMFANNETGDLLPIKEIGQLLHNHQAVFHVDAVQAVGKVPVHPKELDIDFLSASAHKFHGPKGVGFLYSRLKQFDPLIQGGKQEESRRAGTENLASIAAMAAALEEQAANLTEHLEKVKSIKNELLTKLEHVDHYVNQGLSTLPHVLNIGFPNQLNERLLMRLDLAGIAVSSGSACTAGVIEKSHVLKAYYGEESHRLTESIRISFSDQTSLEDIHSLANTLKEIIGGA